MLFGLDSKKPTVFKNWTREFEYWLDIFDIKNFTVKFFRYDKLLC